MAWIESHQTLREHPKTLKAARLLEISPVQVIGHLMCLWWWAMDYAQDGDLTLYDHAEIAKAAEWEGETETFIFSLLNCGKGGGPGFLESDNETLFIHDWYDYAGKLIERRKEDAERKRCARRPVRLSEDQLPLGLGLGGVQSASERCPGDVHTLSVVTLPNPTLPNTTEEEDAATPPPPPTEPPADDSLKEKKPEPERYTAITPAGIEFFKQFHRKRWKTTQQRDDFEKCEAEVGPEAMLDAVAWAAREGRAKVGSICTAARKRRRQGGGQDGACAGGSVDDAESEGRGTPENIRRARRIVKERQQAAIASLSVLRQADRASPEDLQGVRPGT